MKNALISFSLFLLLLVGMYFSLNYLKSTCTKILADSTKLEELILDEKWEDADKLSNDLYYYWENKSMVLSIFVNHMEIDALNNEILKLTQYVRTKSKDESLASTHVVKFYTNSIINLQKITIQNIL
ncbi:DUF4363 family protein [Clostridium thermarum]|uniref:DUF4363 family protein n=1 Tax=Clostridium thermarum TaxID=1716543 RepID=UPI0011217B85|nr:DUF4363 family protein [Clostridium thermarum]